MELIIDNLETAPLYHLKKLQSVEADLEIARRVVNNDKAAVQYFLGNFSIPFLDYIGKTIMKLDGHYIDDVLCFYPDIAGEYYEFIGAKFVDQKPTCHKVSLYKGIKNKGEKEARLYTYINTITVRHFVALKKKSDKKDEKNYEDMPEYMSISILKDYEGFDEISFDKDDPRFLELDAAWRKLPEKYRLILTYLVIEDRKPIEIFDEMIQYVDTHIPPEQYTRKQKQDAMALMKQYAKRCLRNIILEQRIQKKQ